MNVALTLCDIIEFNGFDMAGRQYFSRSAMHCRIAGQNVQVGSKFDGSSAVANYGGVVCAHCPAKRMVLFYEIYSILEGM